MLQLCPLIGCEPSLLVEFSSLCNLTTIALPSTASPHGSVIHTQMDYYENPSGIISPFKLCSLLGLQAPMLVVTRTYLGPQGSFVYHHLSTAFVSSLSLSLPHQH